MSNKNPQQMINFYRRSPKDFLLTETRKQYISMAKGGSGTPMVVVRNNELATLRGSCYSDYPDSFFQEVCDGMGWNYGQARKKE